MADDTVPGIATTHVAADRIITVDCLLEAFVAEGQAVVTYRGEGGRVRPARWAMTTSCVRSRASSFVSRWLTCVLAVE